MTKIYDAFLFFNELDLLEIRLNTLDPCVDYFIISECDHTFTGKPKLFYYEENKERFKKFHDKIIHVKHHNTDRVDFPLEFEDPRKKSLYREIQNHFHNHDHKGAWSQAHWCRDFQHREFTKFGMLDMNDDDILIFSDVDEIPNPELFGNVKEWCEPDTVYALRQKMFHFYLNLNSPMEDNWWGPKVLRYGCARGKSVGEIRLLRENGTISVADGGWHFTAVGNIDFIKKKVESWGHQEYNNDFIKDNIEQRVKEGKDIFFRTDMKYVPFPVSETMPKYIVENREKFSDLIMET